MTTSRKILALAVSSALAGLAGNSFGAGFQLMEQNASGLGSAYSGTAALAEDASTVFFNPAGISKLGKQNVAVVMSMIGPSAEFTGQAVPTVPAPLLIGAANAFNASGNGGDAGSWAFVPAMYYAMNITPTIGLGIGVNAPFGLKTEYDFPWRGQTLGILSELKTMDINPVISFKISDAFSVGAGFSYQRAEATLSSATGPGPAAGIAQLEGDDWGWGWNIGALWQVTPTVRLGVNYRSEVDHTLEGTFTVSNPALAAPVTADLTLPSILTFSGTWDVTPAWKLMADIARTGWDSFDRLAPVVVGIPPLAPTPENWENTWRYAIGTAYQVNQQFKVRVGVAYDESPVPDAFRTVRVPDNDRTWLSIGGQWKFGQGGAIDFGYAHIFVKDSSFCYNVAGAPCSATPQVQLQGNYENSVDVISVQYSQTF